jgi:centromere protein V
MLKHRGGCHCGNVRFEITAPARIVVSQCNCSICTKTGYLGLIIPRENFTLLKGFDDLTEYRFNTGSAIHTFCKYCGIKSFYYPRSHPEGVNINARCLDAETIADMQIRDVDGQNWESVYPADKERTYRVWEE